MIFDGNSAEVNAFRARLPLHVDDGGPVGGLMLAGVDDDDHGVMSITTNRNLLETTKPGPYWIVGEIASLENVADWCYLGCTDCNKKVIPDGESFRFKVNVRVYDSTGHASFILWDRECKNVLGASAFLLREIMLERNMDPNLLPTELNRFLGQKCLFNVLLKPDVGSPHWIGPRAFGVRSLVTDPKILKNYEHVAFVKDEEVEEESEGWWNSLEDLSQKVNEVIGTSEPSSSQSVNTRPRKIDDVDENDSETFSLSILYVDLLS
ncbi:unnamed protein product [Cuscuta campestris]|uniref:Replication factor A C-terminal domain-containing protein n=1 Tax=Cuscuta campestris TaxID=132261 RepID=A0A484MHA4_9ASTE|nr:unnamed protein product [Cuscuta campestris]